MAQNIYCVTRDSIKPCKKQAFFLAKVTWQGHWSDLVDAQTTNPINCVHVSSRVTAAVELMSEVLGLSLAMLARIRVISAEVARHFLEILEGLRL